MADGVRLSARIWLPADPAALPVPALLEYLPYRLGDWTAPRDAERHPWYAAHGYASVRVDLRGSGDSDGVMTDEYSAVELDDGVQVITWLARQPWCTGAVGMFGISWGGFNSLQLAALAPEPLKAIVTVCSTDDRYADDVHYFGGAVLGVDMAAWATTMLAFTALPPDPDRVGDRWRALWMQRLESCEPYLDRWLEHQERDDYWRHGSVCEDYPAITAAVLAVGGWADPYRNTVFRLLAGLRCPVKGIVGPWSHQYPDRQLEPGPAIGFLQETLRWWDHWLKGEPTGVVDDPALRVWLQESVRPATRYATRPGRWIGERQWPSPAVTQVRYPLSGLHCSSTVGGQVLVASPQHTGIDAGRYFPFGNPADLPPDQRAEDGRSVCFDTDSLAEPVELLGNAALTLGLTATHPATVIVRLCDVAADGSSTLVTRGCLNLLSRNGMDHVTPVQPGEQMTVQVPLVAMGWAFPAGHRIRVAVSNSYWPWVWPHGTASELRVDVDASQLLLPTREPGAPSEPVSFQPPEQSEPLAVVHRLRPASEPARQVSHEPETGRWTLTVDPDYGGARAYPDGLRYDEQALETYQIVADDPLSAIADSSWRIGLSRPGWDVQISVTATMRADPHALSDRSSIVGSTGWGTCLRTVLAATCPTNIVLSPQCAPAPRRPVHGAPASDQRTTMTTPPRAKRAVDRVRQPTEIRRGLIIEAARGLIADRGLFAASLRDIAQRAQVSLGTVTYHFAGIAELLSAVLHAEMVDFYRPITARAAVEPDGRLALEMIIDGFFADGTRTMEHWRLWLDFWTLSAHEQTYADWQAEVYTQWRAEVVAILERGQVAGSLQFQDVETAAIEFMAVFDGWAAQAFLPRGAIDPARGRALLHDYVRRRLVREHDSSAGR